MEPKCPLFTRHLCTLISISSLSAQEKIRLCTYCYQLHSNLHQRNYHNKDWRSNLRLYLFGGLGYLLSRNVAVAKHCCGTRYLCAQLMKQCCSAHCTFSFIPQCLRFDYEELHIGSVTSDNTNKNSQLFSCPSSFS